MSARKLGRVAGLVFMLAALFGGVGAQHLADASPSAEVSSQLIIIDWS